MAAEYSFVPTQTVAADENVLFNNGSRACRKGCISHRDDSGLFEIKGAGNGGCAIYKVQFTGNIAVAPAADGGVLEPISVALTIGGETIGNTIAVATPAAIGDFWNVAITTFVSVSCGCCKMVSIENASPTSAIDVANANIVFERVA